MFSRVEAQSEEVCHDRLTFRQSNSVTLAVQQTSQLLQVALPLHVVLDGRGLHEEGVEAVLLPDPVNAGAVTGGVDTWLGRLHKCIYFLVSWNCGALMTAITV